MTGSGEDRVDVDVLHAGRPGSVVCPQGLIDVMHASEQLESCRFEGLEPDGESSDAEIQKCAGLVEIQALGVAFE